MRTQQINETFGTQAVRDFRLREDSSIQLWVSDAREDKCPSITQEVEDRLLASSLEIAIHAEGDVESDSTPQLPTAEKKSPPEDKVPGQRNSQPVMLGQTEVRKVVLHNRRCTLVPIVEKSAGEGPHLLESGG